MRPCVVAFSGRENFQCVICRAPADRALPSCSSCGGEASFAQIDGARLALVQKVPQIGPARAGQPNARKARVEQLSTVAQVEVSRLITIPAIDVVLGGEGHDGEIEPGVALGSLVQIAGDPGAGKSTLLLQACGAVASRGQDVLYGTGEESASKIRSRAERLNLFSGDDGNTCAAHLGVLATRVIEEFLDEVRKRRPALAVYDSEQVARSRVLEAPSRSAQMVLYVADQTFTLAHLLGETVIVLVRQMVKDGSAAGPLAADHWSDANLMFRRDGQIRVLSCEKNRDGPEHRTARLAMTARGLVSCEDAPAEADLQG